MIVYPTTKQKQTIKRRMLRTKITSTLNRFGTRAKSTLGRLDTDYQSNSQYESLYKQKDIKVIQKTPENNYND
jgi:hypothetical protein